MNWVPTLSSTASMSGHSAARSKVAARASRSSLLTNHQSATAVPATHTTRKAVPSLRLTTGLIDEPTISIDCDHLAVLDQR